MLEKPFRKEEDQQAQEETRQGRGRPHSPRGYGTQNIPRPDAVKDLMLLPVSAALAGPLRPRRWLPG